MPLCRAIEDRVGLLLCLFAMTVGARKSVEPGDGENHWLCLIDLRGHRQQGSVGAVPFSQLERRVVVPSKSPCEFVDHNNGQKTCERLIFHHNTCCPPRRPPHATLGVSPAALARSASGDD